MTFMFYMFEIEMSDYIKPEEIKFCSVFVSRKQSFVWEIDAFLQKLPIT